MKASDKKHGKGIDVGRSESNSHAERMTQEFSNKLTFYSIPVYLLVHNNSA